MSCYPYPGDIIEVAGISSTCIEECKSLLLLSCAYSVYWNFLTFPKCAAWEAILGQITIIKLSPTRVKVLKMSAWQISCRTFGAVTKKAARHSDDDLRRNIAFADNFKVTASKYRWVKCNLIDQSWTGWGWYSNPRKSFPEQNNFSTYKEKVYQILIFSTLNVSSSPSKEISGSFEVALIQGS
jgi:hypothetical protein